MLEHIIQNLNDAEIKMDPFPHLNYDSFFPESEYKNILDNFPKQSDGFMHKLSNMYKKRFVLDLDSYSGNSISKYPNHKNLDYWRWFKEQILHKDLMNAFLEKYADFLPKKFWKNAYPTARVSIDVTPYSIGTHRDRDDKLVSLMLYTPKEHNAEIEDNYGTALFTLKDENMKVTDKHYDFDLFDKHSVALYKPNSMFSWCVLHDSFHGVLPLEHPIPRPTIGYFIKNTTNTKGRFNV